MAGRLPYARRGEQEGGNRNQRAHLVGQRPGMGEDARN